MAIEIKYLRLVKAIVEEGGITAAMKVLHLSQSALSYQLKELELQVGAPIFTRRNKKLILTEIGKKLYGTSTKVLSELDTAEQDIRRMIDGEKGVIRVSTECYTSYHWLPAVLEQFNKVYPQVEVEIVFEATHHPVEQLLEDKLDIAVTSNTGNSEKTEALQLFTDEMLAVVSKHHPWAERDFVCPEDFAGVSLFIHSLPLETVSIYRAFLTPMGIEPKKLIVLPLTEATIEMVKAGMGVVVMAGWAVQPYLDEQIRTIRINKEGFFRQQYIVRRSDRVQAPYINHFIRFLKEAIGKRSFI